MNHELNGWEIDCMDVKDSSQIESFFDPLGSNVVHLLFSLDSAHSKIRDLESRLNKIETIRHANPPTR